MQRREAMEAESTHALFIVVAGLHCCKWLSKRNLSFHPTWIKKVNREKMSNMSTSFKNRVILLTWMIVTRTCILCCTSKSDHLDPIDWVKIVLSNGLGISCSQPISIQN